MLPESQEKGKNTVLEELLKETKSENYQNLVKDMNLQTLEAECAQTR